MKRAICLHAVSLATASRKEQIVRLGGWIFGDEADKHHPLYGRTLTREDWPELSQIVTKARRLQLGNRIACLIEGEEDVASKESAFWAFGADVFKLTFRTRRRDALWFPKSVIAEGRNALFAAAALWELQLGQRYLYYVFVDADADVDDWTAGWQDFVDFLFDWEPAVGLPELFDYSQVLGEYRQSDSSDVRSVLNFDHTVVAVHSDASHWLLPYVIDLDDDCQWVSQWRFSSLANALFPENTLLTHKLVVKNPHHASYSKSRCLELMLSVTDELREDTDFKSCFVEPSNKALVVDGMPRLTAYLPWFSPRKRDTQMNYSEPPQMKSCDQEPVVQAMNEDETYSWCRGCPISVAFAVLQTIVTSRPFVFTAWLKLANLLAVAAATREDLVVSHVALTVAGRLLWCAGGVKGSEINPEELNQFWEGHRQLGIHLAPTGETIEELEDLIMSMGEGVVYNSVRAALSPFEATPEVKPAMISEENLRTLVNIVKYCNEPEVGLVLIDKL
ncbi:Uncharacterized protein (Fragment) [Durusdinium trenchii]|uniref:Uncharacterized protein n=1 Tax=Durusdinium trenchii TaxID=1381693 RepID=A0ABP0L437_9DINO